MAALLETPYARSLLGAITNNPQWGINLSDYSTVPQDFSQNSGSGKYVVKPDIF